MLRKKLISTWGCDLVVQNKIEIDSDWCRKKKIFDDRKDRIGTEIYAKYIIHIRHAVLDHGRGSIKQQMCSIYLNSEQMNFEKSQPMYLYFVDIGIYEQVDAACSQYSANVIRTAIICDSEYFIRVEAMQSIYIAWSM